MLKTATETRGLVLSGPTMGSRWEVRVDDPLADADRARLQAALQAAVDEVDAQMSTWQPDSALMRLNAAPLNVWLPLPRALLTVLAAGLSVSAATDGAFEMNMGASVRAWGFGPDPIDLSAIRAASAAPRICATDALHLDEAMCLARKTAPMSLDLCGIAKGYGVDRLTDTARAQGLTHALCAIDGEVRALGGRRDGQPWAVGIDSPIHAERGSHSVIALTDAAVATSGTYRHFIDIRGQRLAHTMNPTTGTPVVNSAASVTVLGQTCMIADAMATALLVMGAKKGAELAAAQGLHSLFLVPQGQELLASGTGIFSTPVASGPDMP
jgi:FAD:protein FMN transferase